MIPPVRAAQTFEASAREDKSRRTDRPAGTLPRPELITTSHALDRAFVGERCELVRADGTSKVISVARWVRDASATDLDLFVEPCLGPTLDVGCGPGRLTAALTVRGLRALGIDISPEAVRMTRARGAMAVRRDVFTQMMPEVLWQHVLLADGNIGLGGDPLRLLRRVAALLSPSGSALVELSSPDERSGVHERVRLRVGHRISAEFNWATVGADVIHDLAQESGLLVAQVRSAAGRVVATLGHQTSAARATLGGDDTPNPGEDSTARSDRR